MTENTSIESIWTGDYLRRKDEALYLTNYLASRYSAKKFESGFVLAINADWGMGKTFLLERWSKDIETSGHPVVRFNAWENDFTSEALVAFIAELDKSLKPFFSKIAVAKRLRKEWLKKAQAVVIPSLKIAGLAALKHGVGIEASHLQAIYTAATGDVVEDDSDSTTVTSKDLKEDKKGFDYKSLQEKLSKAVEEKLKEHISTREAISAFKEKFAALIEQLEKDRIQLPIYVFIDELDRCRPDYAIRLLEGIKHLFGIPGLYFIIATNISELSHSIKAVYGEGFGSERYLKRFFDLEYSLPEPNEPAFYSELMAPLADLLGPPLISGLDEFVDMRSLPLRGLPFYFAHYCEAFELTLRDQHQVARIMETALISLNKESVHIHFLLFLAALYQKNSSVYRAVVSNLNLSILSEEAKSTINNIKGVFSFKTWDGHDERVSKITCLEIAQRYFSFLRSENSGVMQAVTYAFPANLHRNLVRSSASEMSIRRYIEIVRRAGNFT